MYDMLQPYFSTAAIILIAVFVLVAAILVFRSLNNKVRGRKGTRLGITEYYEFGDNRRLVLIRRDDVEHLVLVGGPQDLVIESSITSNAMPQPEIPPAPQETQLRAPRPAVFGSQRPPLRPVPPMYDPGNGNM
jgi:flagellar biogenesis protein FliO